MYRLILTLAFLPALAAAQDPVVLDLPTPRPVEADVAVTRVIDLRADTASVGEAKVGLFNRRRPVVLRGGAAADVGAYLGAALPVGEGRTPVVAGIDLILISEQTTAVAEFGRAEVRLRFFEEVDGGLAEIGGAQALTEGSGMDVTRGHADRLAEALDIAAREFVRSERPDGAGVAAVPEADLAPLPVASATEAAATLTEEAARSLRMVVTAGPVVGANATGLRLGYGMRRVEDGAGWSFPLGFEATVLQTENPETGREGTFTSYSGSALAARRLGDSPLYLQPGLQVTIGTEQVSGRTELFGGGRLGADLMLYPADKGVVAGVGVYGSRLFGSDLYPRDVGVSGVLGVQF